MINLRERLWEEEAGQDLVEYALFLLFLSFFAIASLNAIAGGLSTMFTSAATSLTNTS